MANPEMRLFETIREASKEPKVNNFITLSVKSLSPFVLTDGDRLNIDESFLVFNKNIDITKVSVGDTFTIAVYNDNQVYYVMQPKVTTNDVYNIATKEYVDNGDKYLRNAYSSRPTSCDLEATGKGGIKTLKATSSMTTGKPPHDAHVIHMDWDNNAGFDAQMALGTGADNRLYTRTQSSGTWGDWEAYVKESNLDYSTSEKQIGKWINGKPLYRRVFNGTKSTIQNLVNYSNHNREQIIKVDGVATADNNVQLPLHNTFSDTGFHWECFWTSVQKCTFNFGNRFSDDGQVIFILEYTKTTD